MLTKYVVDTSTLLRTPDVVSKYDCVITAPVLRELEKHKLSRDEGLKFQVREATRALIDSSVEVDWKDYTFSLNDEFDPQYNDNKLLQACINNGYGLITDDLLLRLKAKGFGIEVVVPTEQELYTGYMDVRLSDEELALVYESPKVNNLGLLLNQYLIIRDCHGNVKDKFKWKSGGLQKIKKKTIDSKWAGKVKPINLEQELYMDMLFDDEITTKAVSGVAGSGKDFLALSYFLDLVDKGRYKKIIWIRNNIDARNTNQLGFLPGSATDKLSPYADLIGDFLGEKSEMNKLIGEGKIELVHTGHLRGRDFRGAVVYCSEAQNTTKDLMHLIGTRPADGSVIFLNGDVEQSDIGHSGHNNGLFAAINQFKGDPIFGHVRLNRTERSEIARLFSKLR